MRQQRRHIQTAGATQQFHRTDAVLKPALLHCPGFFGQVQMYAHAKFTRQRRRRAQQVLGAGIVAMWADPDADPAVRAAVPFTDQPACLRQSGRCCLLVAE